MTDKEKIAALDRVLDAARVLRVAVLGKSPDVKYLEGRLQDEIDELWI